MSFRVGEVEPWRNRSLLAASLYGLMLKKMDLIGGAHAGGARANHFAMVPTLGRESSPRNMYHQGIVLFHCVRVSKRRSRPFAMVPTTTWNRSEAKPKGAVF